MAPLKIAAASLVLLIAAPARAQTAPDPVECWQSIAAEASQRFGIPEAWILAVMRAESGGHTRLNGRPIISKAGAMGLMQLMPATWAEMRRRLGLGANPHDPRDNIMAGAAYLRLMYDRFGYPGLFAAYNAGPARYGAHLASGTPLPGETRAYIATLARTAPTPAMPSAILSGERLFAVRRDTADAPGEADGRASLFVDLTPARDRK